MRLQSLAAFLQSKGCACRESGHLFAPFRFLGTGRRDKPYPGGAKMTVGVICHRE